MNVIAHVLHMCDLRAMAKMLQVRNIPDRLHRELMRRARMEGRTVTEYVQRVLEREIAKPPREEVFARISRRQKVCLTQPAAELIAEERTRRRAS